MAQKEKLTEDEREALVARLKNGLKQCAEKMRPTVAIPVWRKHPLEHEQVWMNIFWSLDDRCVKGSVTVTNSEGEEFKTPVGELEEEFLIPYFDEIWDGITFTLGGVAAAISPLYDGCDDAIPLKDYLDVTEAAELSGYGEQHIRRLCRLGTLKGAVLRRGKWFVPKKSLEEYKPGPQGFAAVWEKRKSNEERK